MFFAENNFIKVELGVGKQKSLTDKRDDIQKRDGEREIRRVMKCGGYDWRNELKSMSRLSSKKHDELLDV